MNIPELPENLEGKRVEYTFKQITAFLEEGSYNIKEPKLTPEEEHNYELIKTGLYEILNIDINTDKDTEQYIKDCLHLILAELKIKQTEETKQKVTYQIYKDFIGYGKIQALVLDPLVKEIRHSTGLPIEIEHVTYGTLKTNIELSEKETEQIIKKLQAHCDQEEETFSAQTKDFKVEVSEELFTITKNYPELPTPADLINQNKASPEMLAFLWMVIENKQDIVVQDPLFLSPLSYFLAPHSKLLINLKGFIPPLYLQTTFSSQEQSQDYAFLINYNEQQIKSPRVVSTKDSPDKGIICETENNVITKIKEDGKEIFLLYNNKFYQNTSNSNFLKTKGNIQIQQEELNLRSKLLLTLAKGNIPKKDLRKVISIYYDNPTAVLRKAGII
tara:strand:- start:1266 stop:2429 length:1164 start_codon:yes stop_codon:yes gene_type:complete